MDNLEGHWENIHTDKFKDVSWWQEESALWIDLFENENIPPDSSIIDVGSGASMLLDQLHERGFTQLSALDISESALNRLRIEIIKDRYPVNFYHANVLDFDAEDTFEVWHDRAVFHFLTDPNDQARYVESVRRNLAPKGLLILATFAPDGPDRCSNLSVAKHDWHSLKAIFGEDFELTHEESRVHTTPWGSTQAFTVVKFRFKPEGAKEL